MDSSNYLLDLASSQPQSAVEKFAANHESISGLKSLEPKAKSYRSLIPSALPGQGEQYAFEVNLDRCSACKACVSACHHMNGLSSDESWRRVQQWIGESGTDTWFQTVTSACHHCVNPECMNGCPVGAYEKNGITGIVKHLDDQCIGCEYCIWKCPYEVPKYHESHGVVRKCDMCSERLENQIEPACVQACPHDAIKIGIASEDALVNDLMHKRNRDKGIYPGAPASSITQPSSQYKTNHIKMEASWTSMNLNEPDSKPHWPLIFMLTLTQFGIGVLSSRWIGTAFSDVPNSFSISYFIGLAFLFVGLGSSVFHLGQPQKAWKFFLGLKTSWLSREILCFNIFAGLVVLDMMNLFFPLIPQSMESYWHSILIIFGCLSVMTSIMIYHDTRRPKWDFARTAPKFAATLCTGAAFGFIISAILFSDSVSSLGIVFGCLTVLLVEGMKVHHLRSHKTESKAARYSQGIGLIVAVAILCVALTWSFLSIPILTLFTLTIAMFGCLAIEFTERYHFFTSSTPPMAKSIHQTVRL